LRIGPLELRAAEGCPEDGAEDVTADDLLLGTTYAGVEMSKEMAMAIPAFASCVDVIAGTMAMLPVRLYRRHGEEVEEVEGDPRVAMLNGESGDAMSGPEIVAAMVEDYYTSDNGGFMFVDRPAYGNGVRSLRYVRSEEVAVVQAGPYDPIYKDSVVLVQGRRYEPWQFVHVARGTRDGRTGRSIVSENAVALAVAYQTMVYEHSLVRRGGNKRGFLQASRHLGKKAFAALKAAWRRFYGSTEENVIALNDGVTFQEASASSVEMQMNERKQGNAKEIYGLFKVPEEVIRCGSTANASRDARNNFVRFCIMPLAATFRAALDEALLLEAEKPELYFDFDLTELTKADMKERWEAWQIARSMNAMQIDEIRRAENLPPLGIRYMTMGLDDVLYDPADNRVIVLNMAKAMDLDELPSVAVGDAREGGDGDGDGDKGLDGGGQRLRERRGPRVAPDA